MTIPGADDRILDAGNSRRGSPVQVLCALLLACVVAGVFASGPIAGWARDLPDGPITEHVQDATVWWDQSVSRFGAARPYDWLHKLVRGVRKAD
jgi:hypothetical protein